MNRILAFFVTIAWAMWFGGILALFLFVTRLFANNLGPTGAPVLFHAFEQFQIWVAAVAIVATLLWLLVARSRWKIIILAMLVLAAVSAGVSTLTITPRIDEMREAGQTRTDEFRRVHGRSMMVYSTQAALLLLVGTMLAMEFRPATRKND